MRACRFSLDHCITALTPQHEILLETYWWRGFLNRSPPGNKHYPSLLPISYYSDIAFEYKMITRLRDK